MGKMTSRERLMTALEHKEPDMVPLDLGGNQTGIHKHAYRKLLECYGLKEDIIIMDAVQQLARPSEQVLQLLEIDTRYVLPGMLSQAELEYKEVKPGYFGFTDAWGVVWAAPAPPGEGLYYDIVHSPLADFSLEDLDHYDWPDPKDSELFRGLREYAKHLYENTDYALVSGITGVVFELCWYMRGFEQFYIDMLTNRPFVEKLMDITLEYWLAFEEAFLDEVGEYLQVVCVGDDVAMQSGPLFSPRIYREIVKPRQKKLYDFIKKHTGAKLWYHCCGSVREYIPDFIENGVDILNPIQVSAVGMDSAELKAEFGDRLCFWGGIDTQHVLPRGTPEEVRAEVKRRMEDFKPGGGYVFNTVHNIQADVPMENLAALWEAAKEYRHYGSVKI